MYVMEMSPENVGIHEISLEWECPVNQPKSTKFRIEKLSLSDSSKVSKVSNLTPIYIQFTKLFLKKKITGVFFCVFFLCHKNCANENC